uniref:Immunoglobulin domain-containing protein n=1 Tax=Cyprinus carpio carpio TaxID=630221 RepID=A0A9J7YF68_CYPCA
MTMETLLLMFLLTHAAGTQDIHTVSKISVQKQQKITIPCLYDQKYVSFPKYMSRGGVWIFSQHVSHNRMSVEDNQAENVFTATLSEAEVSDSGTYWCAVTVSGSDPHVYLDLQVTEAEARLRVSSQTVSGYEGGNVTILCHGASHWCTIRGACVGRDGGSLERTAVSDDGGDVLRVTLWQLQKEDSGWYYCSNENSQMPVNVTVMEALDITQFTTNPSYSTTPLGEDRLDFRRFLWLLLLGAMLPITVCGAVMLIKARNKRKKRAEISNLHDDMNIQQLPKKNGKNNEVACENLYGFTTGNKPITQGNGKNNEVACEDLYETMTGNKQITQGNWKNNEVACENLYGFTTGNKPITQGNWKNNEVSCEDLYETMTGNKQNTQLTATDDKNIYGHKSE